MEDRGGDLPKHAVNLHSNAKIAGASHMSASDHPISPLRQRMPEDMRMRNPISGASMPPYSAGGSPSKPQRTFFRSLIISLS